ncbi:hypothetical protein PG995_008512 [Apiospora arundinis]
MRGGAPGVEALLADLANCDTTTWRQRLRSKKKKLSYAFDRPKVQQLVQRLHNSNQVLQTAITGLNLEISGSITERMTTIDLSFRGHSSQLRSEVSGAITPLVDAFDRVVTADQLHESSRAIQGVVERSHDLLRLTISEKMERVEKLLESLQPPGALAQYTGNLVCRVASKPAALRKLCDNIYDPRQNPYQSSAPGHLPRQPLSSVSSFVHGQRFTSTSVAELICICPRSHRSIAHKTVQLGHLHLSTELESRGHWSGCPLSRTQSTRENRRTVGVKYAGLTRLISSMVGVSFTMTSGAGGFSIGTDLAYYPTIDDQLDPSFRILGFIIRFSILACREQGEEEAYFTVACMERLARLFDEKKASPTAVNYQGKSLMHFATDAVWFSEIIGSAERPFARFFPQLITTLLQYGVPAMTYNNGGDSPLLGFYKNERPKGRIQEIVNMLVLANSEGNSAAMNPSKVAHDAFRNVSWTSNIESLYSVSYEYAEACDCGPLSMAVIRNDSNEVARILDRFPDSLLEADIYKQSPLHLAAAKPGILSLLVQNADTATLEQADLAGIRPIEAAIMRSGDCCTHGTSNKRCRRCGCTECVDILLHAGCGVRTHTLDHDDLGLKLYQILEPASELARRRYIFAMQQARKSLARLDAPRRPTRDVTASPGDIDTIDGNSDEAEQWRLLYSIAMDSDPTHLSFAIRVWLRVLNMDYLWWLVEHGADLFAELSTELPTRNPMGFPTRKNDSGGLYGAHYFFFFAGASTRFVAPKSDELAKFNKLSTNVICHNLTDGCKCHCSIEGCDPFLWFIKSWLPWLWAGTKIYFDTIQQNMEHFSSECGAELTALTYEAVIRYATFEALGLNHTCCGLSTPILSHMSIPCCVWPLWVKSDEAAIINEDQALLLELHEKLVAEFTEIAHEYVKRKSFPDFWGKVWIRRMEEELDELDGCSLSDAERRGAEEIGVRWCEPPAAKETQDENPYKWESMEWFYFELDRL